MPGSTRPTPIPIDVRRAVLAVFFRCGPSGGPLSLDTIVHRTRTESGLDLAELPGVPPRRRVSDILRHQVRYGRAASPARGWYQLDTTAFSESTRWRCLNWQHVADRRGPYSRYITKYRDEP